MRIPIKTKMTFEPPIFMPLPGCTLPELMQSKRIYRAFTNKRLKYVETFLCIGIVEKMLDVNTD